MTLDEETKENIRVAILSHAHCVHESAVLCHALILSELEFRRGYSVSSEEELEACGIFIADVTLENLILKGFVEVAGVSEEGEIMVGLTEAGYMVTDQIKQQIDEERKESDGTS